MTGTKALNWLKKFREIQGCTLTTIGLSTLDDAIEELEAILYRNKSLLECDERYKKLQSDYDLLCEELETAQAENAFNKRRWHEMAEALQTQNTKAQS